MGDCATLETAFSHYVSALAGSLISTTLISISLFVYDWRMAFAAVWVLPIAFIITFFSARIQEYFNRKSVAANVALESGVQECIESLQDLKANNAEESYLSELGKKIDDVEKRHIITELGTALFVVSSTLILKFGIATVALVGSVLLIRGEIDVPLFFLFLLVASRLYAPLEGALQNLAAVISTRTNINRMNEILDQPVQTGTDRVTNKGYDIVFGVFKQRKFSWFKNLTGAVSRFLLWHLLDRPKDIQMSSFWCCRKYVRDEVVKYDGYNTFLQVLFFQHHT